MNSKCSLSIRKKQSAASKGRDINTEFTYYKDPGDGSPPPLSYVGRPETYKRPVETQTHVVHDIRGEEDVYTLDTKGFQIYKHVCQETAFVDEEQIKRQYYPEIEDILKSASTSTNPTKPAPSASPAHLPAEAEHLLKGRYQIINVWRPIKTIRKDPLGVADATCVPDKDLLAVEIIYPDRVGRLLPWIWSDS
ncbi:MAG: hypothetical protein Q9186_006538 [Xanthomendoza sp. 1 TL-2023]